MSKAILVIDMPNNCSECPCCNEEECGNQYKGYISDYLKWNSGRPSWCPLKPLGKRVEEYELETWTTRDGIFLCEKGLFEKMYGDDEEDE